MALIIDHRAYILNCYNHSPLSLLGRKYIEKIPSEIRENRTYQWLNSTSEFKDSLAVIEKIKFNNSLDEYKSFIDFLWGFSLCLSKVKIYEGSNSKPKTLKTSEKRNTINKIKGILKLIDDGKLRLHSIEDHHSLISSLNKLSQQLEHEKKRPYSGQYAAEQEAIEALVKSLRKIDGITTRNTMFIAKSISNLFKNRPNERTIQRFVSGSSKARILKKIR